jgi:tripartite-type tricarboxylate transporter receptor subunit TctC
MTGTARALKQLAQVAMRERLSREGADTMAWSADQFRSFVHAEVAKFGKIIRDAGVKAE